MKKCLVLGLAVLLLSVVASLQPVMAQMDDGQQFQGEAQQPMPDQDGQMQQEPPPVAFSACDNKREGENCDFPGAQGESVQGTCSAPSDGPLLCVPIQFDQNNAAKVR